MLNVGHCSLNSACALEIWILSRDWLDQHKPVACVAYYLVYPAFFVIRGMGLWCDLLELLAYGFSFKYYAYVCVFE